MAALDALKAEYALKRFHRSGSPAAGTRSRRCCRCATDIGCAVMTSGSMSVRR